MHKCIHEQFNHIVYTGSSNVGRIVMAAAAKHLTPVTLELGGKNAAILDSSANLAVCAERIAVFKALNMGQICLATDYILVQDTVVDEFTDLLVSNFEKFFSGNQKERRNVGKIVNSRHAERVKNLLDVSCSYV
jgi:acyl-CoA reductase-like NAD-dependent aldehyde dehydrogenase